MGDQKAVFEECYSTAKNISSPLLKYFVKYNEFEKKGYNIDPYTYTKLTIHSMLVFRLIEKEIESMDLSYEEKNTIDVLKRYKNRDISDLSHKNYLKFSVWVNTDGDIRFRLSDVRQDLKEEINWKMITAYLVPHTNIIKTSNAIFLKAAMKHDLIEL
ncbi:hypothetical protein HNP87_000781 [Methanococcus maripaludis]|uniref:Uncharacterized protein n=1 Tax=Methanococcus maripaludis TaxID=39152 RepID=A0A7J9S4L9_METMI|nr:hypothetical protein [Methanococcus maripaludis]MBA2840269.1 hypothetical protein [Methanococcus maripaludis]MBA2852876.1 hypothetical protein [Methanococcus maripaludis]MBA2859981.1 hypothetical protein [Methanococcus maripaludis]MBA2868622.1 hypothetical protein [Methanococcus maripaludis]MBB6400774.1 hypothetical protein [Methanococcus maripaludis]